MIDIRLLKFFLASVFSLLLFMSINAASANANYDICNNLKTLDGVNSCKAARSSATVRLPRIITPNGIATLNKSGCYKMEDDGYNQGIKKLGSMTFGLQEDPISNIGCMTYPYRGLDYNAVGNQVHAGMDFKVSKDKANPSKIFAVTGGTVIREILESADNCNTGHSTLVIDDGNYYVLYLHMSKHYVNAKVKKDDTPVVVVAGQVLGESGCVGAGVGNEHLHVEVWPKKSKLERKVYNTNLIAVSGSDCGAVNNYVCSDGEINKYTVDPIKLLMATAGNSPTNKTQATPTKTSGVGSNKNNPTNGTSNIPASTVLSSSESASFNGTYYQAQMNFGFRITGNSGVAIKSNSQTYNVGDEMLRFNPSNSKYFTGVQLCTDGKFHAVIGDLQEDNSIDMTIEGCLPNRYKMVRGGALPLPSMPSKTDLKLLITDFYNNKGEWAGIFTLDKIEKMWLKELTENQLIVYVQYTALPIPNNRLHRTDIAHDQRVFTLTNNGNNWVAVQMGGYMSARFL